MKRVGEKNSGEVVLRDDRIEDLRRVEEGRFEMLRRLRITFNFQEIEQRTTS